MITNVNQRWRDHRGTFIVPDDRFDPRNYEVAYIPSDKVAMDFVLQHHYEDGYPAARFRYGLYDRQGQLCGVAIYATIAGNLGTCTPFPWVEVEQVDAVDKKTGEVLLKRNGAPKIRNVYRGAEFCVTLARFVLLDHVEANAESWFIARCHELLRETDVRGIISFSDPFPRTNRTGEQTFVGHVGTIYQATNAVYVGRSRADDKLLFPDGSMVAGRSKSKVQGAEQGADGFARLLEKHGATPRRPWESLVAYVEAWLPLLTRSVKHTGNHKYLWALHRRDRKHLPGSLAYPKLCFEPSRAPQQLLFAA